MTTKRPLAAIRDNIVRLFADRDEVLPETPLDVSHLTRAAKPMMADVAAIPLADTAKAFMAIGPGSVGKTTLIRWICERAMEANAEADLALASVDAVNRDLRTYFAHALAPPTAEPAQITLWLEALLQWLMQQKKSAVIDFGGGDTSLASLVRQVPDLHTMMQDNGVEPVAAYLFSPRVSDLMPLVAMERAGFKPRATALVLNCGRTSDPSSDPEVEFAPLRRHSAYKEVLDRGAVEVWFPRLYAKPATREHRMISFHEAVKHPDVGMIDRHRVFHWLRSVEDAMRPILSWLP